MVSIVKVALTPSYINGLVSPLLMHWRYCSLALSHWYSHSEIYSFAHLIIIRKSKDHILGKWMYRVSWMSTASKVPYHQVNIINEMYPSWPKRNQCRCSLTRNQFYQVVQNLYNCCGGTNIASYVGFSLIFRDSELIILVQIPYDVQ